MSLDKDPIEDGGATINSKTGIGSAERAVNRDSKMSTTDAIGDCLVGPESNVSPVLSVVIPTLNEEEGIGECIDGIERAVAELGMPTEILVSDSSTDRTPEIARERSAIVVRPDQSGYGYGYRYAFERIRGEYVAMGDADTTYDFEEIPHLLRVLQSENVDMVMGNRLGGTIDPGAMPLLHQYVGNPLLTRFLNVFYGAGVSDAHSGFRVFRREMISELDLRTDGMEFASEMIMEASARDFDIEEVPITYSEREGEETLDSFRDGWRHVKFMLLNAPGYVFSAPGALFVFLGAVAMAMSLLGVRFTGIYFGTHTVIAGSLLAIVGYQIASLAVFSSLAADPIRSPKDPMTDWIIEHLDLEHGLLAGWLFFVAGGAYVAGMVYRWVATGYTALPFLKLNIVAFTMIVIGTQTVFSGFFLGMLLQNRDEKDM